MAQFHFVVVAMSVLAAAVAAEFAVLMLVVAGWVAVGEFVDAAAVVVAPDGAAAADDEHDAVLRPSRQQYVRQGYYHF